MSVPSSKMTVTCDRPYLDNERTSWTFGIPPMAHSIGKVIRRSTSTGESAFTGVLIWTWTLVISGTASIGRRPKL
jgi:hypothetical protein